MLFCSWNSLTAAVGLHSSNLSTQKRTLARSHWKAEIHIWSLCKTFIDCGRTSGWTSFGALAISLSLSSPGLSAVVQSDALDRTLPIKQRFLTRGASVVAQGNLQSCRVFSAIDVRASTYSYEAGERVPFTEVERSPAAGLWIIGASKLRLGSVEPAPGVSDNGGILRVVLKYPVEELFMKTDALTVSLKQDLDPAGDSVTLSPTNGAHLRAAWQSGSTVRFVGRSRDTGRTVEDVILPPDQTDVQACAAFEAGGLLGDGTGIDLPEALPDSGTQPGEFASFDGTDVNWQSLVFDPADTRFAHQGHISVYSGARMSGSPSKSELIGCRMTDLGGEIERYRLTQVNGFISHSSEVWVTRDVQGQVRQVYIPGVFEALRKLGTNTWTADVSIASFANDPFEAPVSKGCLG